ncbi:MAG: GNAT family N-acetyltransferase [Streptosporangiaceae bacterium]|nr:GNAT family N-acetyltransferase [Streptosporangiaceae bacterium]MBV9857867.1 GNAT family N-acetyltransferase [Streptosporangiaceae bacterium]
MGQTITFTELDPLAFTAALDGFVAVYAAAMNPPARQLAGREAILERHATYPRFRALAALSGEELAGFCYGFHGAPGQWWHDMVAAALSGLGGPPGASRWLANSLEIAELHVLPSYQGRGIGRELLFRVAAGRPERTAVLSTQDTESRARRLYRRAGFTDLLTGYRFSGGEPPYAVMGAELPLRDGTSSQSPSS